MSAFSVASTLSATISLETFSLGMMALKFFCSAAPTIFESPHPVSCVNVAMVSPEPRAMSFASASRLTSMNSRAPAGVVEQTASRYREAYELITGQPFHAYLERMGLINDLVYICAPAPLQRGVARALEMLPDSYYEDLAREYVAKRDKFCGALSRAGLEPRRTVRRRRRSRARCQQDCRHANRFAHVIPSRVGGPERPSLERRILEHPPREATEEQRHSR